MTIDPRLTRQVAEHPYPLLFATISGAHLYGFPSADSDYDLRGAHLLPLEDVVGLRTGPETIEKSGVHDGLEIDLVTHDAAKFFGLLLRKNGYVLEQVLSPLVVHTTPEHAELIAIARQCITRHHAHHYLAFAETQWRLFRKEHPPHVKPLLYVYRVLLTGIHLMRTGEVEANLARLNETAKLTYVGGLIERKTSGTELGRLEGADIEFHQSEYDRLRGELERTHAESTLPEQPRGAEALHDLLARLRLRQKSTAAQGWQPPLRAREIQGETANDVHQLPRQAKPAFLEMQKYHLSRARAREAVIRTLLAADVARPAGGWESLSLTWNNDESRRTVPFKELIDEARRFGIVRRIQRYLDKKDSIFGGTIDNLATPNWQLKVSTTYAGFTKEVEGPYRSACVELELSEDILHFREEACRCSNEHDPPSKLLTQ